MAAPHPRVVIIRQDTHTGSFWLADLLARHNFSVFFQFAGSCPVGNHSSQESRADVVLRALANGCGCMHAHARVRAFCHTGCTTGTPPLECKGTVVLMSDLSLASELRRKHRVELITWERDNVAKRAISALKDACKAPSLLNHASARDVRGATQTVLYVDPQIYLSAAREGAVARERFVKAAHAVGGSLTGATHALRYEDMQRRPDAEVAALAASQPHPMDTSSHLPSRSTVHARTSRLPPSHRGHSLPRIYLPWAPPPGADGGEPPLPRSTGCTTCSASKPRREPRTQAAAAAPSSRRRQRRSQR